jgi:hypothetical protein
LTQSKFNLFKRHDSLYVFALLILSVGFNLILSFHYYHTTLSPDEELYHSIAMAIINGESVAKVGIHTIGLGQEVTPFYSCFVAFTYFINLSFNSLIVAHITLSCLTIYLLFKTLLLITGRKLLSFLVAASFIFYFPLWAYNYYIMMEVPTVFMLAFTIYLLTRYFIKNTVWYLYSAVAAFSLLTLMNNRFAVLLIVLVSFILVKSIFNRYKMRHFIYSSIIVGMIISPWFIRQYSTYQEFVLFTPLWHNLVAERTELFKKINIVSIEKTNENEFPPEYNKIVKNAENRISYKYYEQMIYDVQNSNILLLRLMRYFTLYDIDYKFLYSKDYRLIPPSSVEYRIIQLIYFLPLLFFTGIGVLQAFRIKNLLIILLSVLLTAHIILHVAIHFIQRYRLTVFPVMLIIAGYGLSQVVKTINRDEF